MDGSVVGRRGKRQADGLAVGCESLTRLGDRAAAKSTLMGDSDMFSFRDGEEVNKSRSPTCHPLLLLETATHSSQAERRSGSTTSCSMKPNI